MEKDKENIVKSWVDSNESKSLILLIIINILSSVINFDIKRS